MSDGFEKDLVQIGNVRYNAIFHSEPPRHETIKFQPEFAKPPKVKVALCGFHFCPGVTNAVSLDTSDIDKNGFLLSIDVTGPGKILEDVEVMWIAVPS